MKRLPIVAAAIGPALVGIAWLAEAKLNPTVPPPHLVYNPQAKVYQLHDSTPYANQTLEQKLLTIRSIDRHEGQLDTRTMTTAQ